MESINVQVDDYLPPSETSRLEDPYVVSILEEEKTPNSPKTLQHPMMKKTNKSP